MLYPHLVRHVYATASSLIGISNTAVNPALEVVNSGPLVLYMGAEAITPLTHGSAQFQLAYTDAAGSARRLTAGNWSMSAATPDAASGTANVFVQIYPSAGTQVLWAMGTASATGGAGTFRYWITTLGGDSPMGLLAG